MIKHVNREVRDTLKAKFFDSQPKFKYGTELPSQFKSFKDLDRQNGNDKWKQVLKKEVDVLNQMNTFRDIGPASHDMIENLKALGSQQRS